MKIEEKQTTKTQVEGITAVIQQQVQSVCEFSSVLRVTKREATWNLRQRKAGTSVILAKPPNLTHQHFGQCFIGSLLQRLITKL
jgi:hypothetical protein